MDTSPICAVDSTASNLSPVDYYDQRGFGKYSGEEIRWEESVERPLHVAVSFVFMATHLSYPSRNWQPPWNWGKTMRVNVFRHRAMIVRFGVNVEKNDELLANNRCNWTLTNKNGHRLVLMNERYWQVVSLFALQSFYFHQMESVIDL